MALRQRRRLQSLGVDGEGLHGALPRRRRQVVGLARRALVSPMVDVARGDSLRLADEIGALVATRDAAGQRCESIGA